MHIGKLDNQKRNIVSTYQARRNRIKQSLNQKNKQLLHDKIQYALDRPRSLSRDNGNDPVSNWYNHEKKSRAQAAKLKKLKSGDRPNPGYNNKFNSSQLPSISRSPKKKRANSAMTRDSDPSRYMGPDGELRTRDYVKKTEESQQMVSKLQSDIKLLEGLSRELKDKSFNNAKTLVQLEKQDPRKEEAKQLKDVDFMNLKIKQLLLKIQLIDEQINEKEGCQGVFNCDVTNEEIQPAEDVANSLQPDECENSKSKEKLVEENTQSKEELVENNTKSKEELFVEEQKMKRCFFWF